MSGGHESSLAGAPLVAGAATPSAPAAADPEPLGAPGSPARARLLAARPHPRLLALVPVLALSAVLNTHRLSQNGYANTFYSAGVKSMLRSFHNFVFVAFDPGGLVSVDKPPIALWVQAISAKLFGFSPLSLLLPEAIAGVLAVALLYHLLTRRIGPLGALAGALALAVFPSFVAVSRENGVDPVLILLLILACAVGLRALESGHWRTLMLCGAIVGLAFNTKTLAAYLVVPGIALAYVVCAPGSIGRRALQLLAAGLMMVIVSFSWIAFVDLTPASQRPYVGSSTNNSELGLTFEYNGLGRVEGQVGGPGRVPVKAGALAHVALSPPGHPPHAHHRSPTPAGARATGAPAPKPTPAKPLTGRVRAAHPVPFGGPAGPLRLFGVGLGDQGGWMLPFALFGLIALGLLCVGGRGRRDPWLAVTLMLGGWFLTEAAVLSLSKGIVHPYYISALAPGAGAMAGAGVAAFIELSRRRDWRLLLAPCAVAITVLVEVTLLQREHYMEWFIPVLIAGAAVGLLALLALRRLAAPAMALTLLLLLAAPGAYASTTWEAPVEGTFPAAGPTQAAGAGGLGVSGRHLDTFLEIIRYVHNHRPGTRWAVLTDAATTAAPFILLDVNAGALAGYSGTDPAIDGRGLARLIAHGDARYVVLGGEFSTRGGNRATAAVLRACRQLSPAAWHDINVSAGGLVLFDCAGRERRLASE
jgi:4-amino-4-deoxy-L-arabinose transferase-like glycosyltransferase